MASCSILVHRSTCVFCLATLEFFFYKLSKKRIEVTYFNFFFRHISIIKMSAEQGLILNKQEYGSHVSLNEYFQHSRNTFNLRNVCMKATIFFLPGACFSNEYSCSNGRCIGDEANCNGFNPCGDSSDCKLSASTVAGIVLGVVFGVAVVGIVTLLVVRKARGRRHQVNCWFPFS